MRSATETHDLTTRARIRNAAIELIGEHGFERASIRMIAQTSGVSPALIVHHFGDKEGLRAECNRYVTQLFTVESDGTEPASATIESLQAALGDLDSYGPALRYLTQMLSADHSSAADDLFDGMLRATLRSVEEQMDAGVIHSQSDPAGTALIFTLLGLAPLVLSRHVARSLGASELTPAAISRMTIPLLELFTNGFYQDDSILQATIAAMRNQERQ